MQRLPPKQKGNIKMYILAFLFVAAVCNADNGNECLKELYPIDRAIQMHLIEEARRVKAFKEYNKLLPVCPVAPGEYYNLECV